MKKKQSNQYHLIVLVFAPKWGIPFFSWLKILISFWTSYFTCTLIAFFIISTSWLCPHDTWNKRTDNMILYIYMYRPIPQSVIVSTRSNGFQIYSLSTSYNFLHRLPSVKYFNTLNANNRDESSAGCVLGWDSWTGEVYTYYINNLRKSQTECHVERKWRVAWHDGTNSLVVSVQKIFDQSLFVCFFAADTWY